MVFVATLTSQKNKDVWCMFGNENRYFIKNTEIKYPNNAVSGGEAVYDFLKGGKSLERQFSSALVLGGGGRMT